MSGFIKKWKESRWDCVRAQKPSLMRFAFNSLSSHSSHPSFLPNNFDTLNISTSINFSDLPYEDDVFSSSLCLKASRNIPEFISCRWTFILWRAALCSSFTLSLGCDSSICELAVSEDADQCWLYKALHITVMSSPDASFSLQAFWKKKKTLKNRSDHLPPSLCEKKTESCVTRVYPSQTDKLW